MYIKINQSIMYQFLLMSYVLINIFYIKETFIENLCIFTIKLLRGEFS